MTVAPAQRASWMAALPTAPAPPATRTVRSRSAPGREAGRAVLCDRQRAVGGRAWDPDARSELEVRAVRQREDTFGRHDRVLLGGPARRAPVAGERHPDAVAGLDAGDPWSDGVDDPGAVVVGNRRLAGRAAEGAAARLPVGGIDARHDHTDPHLPLRGLLEWSLDNLEDRRIAGVRVDDGSHARSEWCPDTEGGPPPAKRWRPMSSGLAVAGGYASGGRPFALSRTA